MSDSTAAAARVERWVWILIYGGLIVLVFGLFVEAADFPLGWSLVTGGAAVIVAGIVLIVVRSRMHTDNS